MLQDQWGREITYLRVSVTDKCNLSCRYCEQAKGVPFISHADILRIEEMYRLVNLFVAEGIKKIRITGGEPLLAKGLLTFIEKIAGLELEDISLTTNGILLATMAQDLKNAGLERVNISIDSLDAKNYRWITQGGDVNKVFAGIEAALTAGLHPVKLNVVVVRGLNDTEIWQMAKLAQDRPLHVRFIELMPIGESGIWSKKNFVSSEESKALLTAQGCKLRPAKVRGNGPAEVFDIPNWCGTVGFIHAISNNFCSSCNRLRLTSDGKLYPCLHSGSSFDIISAIRQGASDEELLAIMRQAVLAKPRRSAIGTQNNCMKTIGG